MSGNFGFDRYLEAYYKLSAAQRDALVHQIVREAQTERAVAIRAFFVALARRCGKALMRGSGALHAAGAAAWLRYQRRRCHRLTAARLYAMDDRMLKDIGVRRGEIDFIVRAKVDPTRRPRGAQRSRDLFEALRHRPDPQPPQRPNASTVVQGSCRASAALNPSLP